MKRLLLSLFLLGLICCQPLTAGPLLSGLTSSTLSGFPGAELTFEGTLDNPFSYDLYLNSWSINLAGFDPADINSDPFLLSPYPLLAGESTEAFNWFQITIPATMAPGQYGGTFTVLGGKSDMDMDELDNVSFQVQVQGEAPSQVPEPGSLTLTLGGLALAAFARWGRRCPTLALALAALTILTVSQPAALASVPMPAYQWHTFYGPEEGSSMNSPLARSAAVDSSGNVYVVGVTTKPGSFAPGVPLHSAEPDPNAYVGYIIKLNPEGQLLWSTYYHVAPNAITIGPNDYLYITGSGSFCNDGILQPPLPGGNDASVCAQTGFVMKMSTNGMLMWYTLHWVNGKAIAADPANGNIYVGGDSNYLWEDRFPQPARYHAVDTPREAPVVLALDADGAYLWHSFQDKGEAHSLCVDSAGNIYLGGLNTQPNGGAAIWKLHGPGSGYSPGTPAANWVWGGSRYVYGLASDSEGNVYATGNAYSWAPLKTLMLHTVDTSPAIFVAKLNSVNECVWYTMYGDQNFYGKSILVDPRGYVLVHGLSPFWAISGDGGALSLHDNHYGNNDGGHFLLALDTNGAYQWHTTYGYPDWERPSAMVQDPNNYSLYLVGSSGAGWSGDGGAQPLNSHGESHDAAYIQKFTLKSTPTLIWADPAPITFGTPLGAGQLNAASNVPGSFSYDPPAGTVLPAGNSQKLSVLFTPNDGDSYNTATKSVMIDVKAAATPVRIVVTPTLIRTPSLVVATLRVANMGGTAADHVLLNVAKIGSTAGTVLPLDLGSIPAGGNAIVTVAFPATVGGSGTTAVLTIGGSYVGGSFSSATRIKLP